MNRSIPKKKKKINNMITLIFSLNFNVTKRVKLYLSNRYNNQI